MPKAGQTIKPLVKLGKRSDDCWEWIGPRHPAGYGKKTFHGQDVLAHRWIWEQLFGPIPAGLVVHHECQNTSCVNPHHLRVCTQAENVREAVTTKLTASDVLDIKRAKPATRTPHLADTLAQRHGCSRQLVYDIWQGRAWSRAQPFYGRRKQPKEASAG